MPDWTTYAALLLLTLDLILVLWIALRRPSDAAASATERLERELRDELGRQGQGTRADLATYQQMLMMQRGDVARTQNEQIDSFRSQLAATQQAVGGSAGAEHARGGGAVACLARIARRGAAPFWRHDFGTTAPAVRGQRTRIRRKSGRRGLPSDPPTSPKPGDDDPAPVDA